MLSDQPIFAEHDLDTEFADAHRKTSSRVSSRGLAASFACCVTVQSSFDDMVARRGSMSLFSAFNKMYPEVYPTTFSKIASLIIDFCLKGRRKSILE